MSASWSSQHCGESIPYNHAAVDAHNEIEPWVNGKLQVRISQHLESKEALLLLLARILAVEAGYEAVESVEHGGVFESTR